MTASLDTRPATITAAVVLLDRSERLLTVCSDATGTYDLPGGVLLPGEQPVVGALRELAGAAAVQLDDDTLHSLGIWDTTDSVDPAQRIVTHVFFTHTRYSAEELHAAAPGALHFIDMHNVDVAVSELLAEEIIPALVGKRG